MRAGALLFLLGLAGAAAAETPPVTGIRFVGNAVTRPEVMLREMSLRPGDPADPDRIARSRQAILDLGLFREVRIEQVPEGDGVALEVHVREKRYVLPIPRGDTSTDRDYSYGGQLRWSNIGGRNHSMNVYLEQGRFRDDPNRERERTARLAYTAPYVFDTPYNLSTSLGRLERVNPGQAGRFDETFHHAELHLSRDLSWRRPRRGWTFGGGLLWQAQRAEGEFAPPSDGEALAAVLSADFHDVRFNVYSESGRRFIARLETASDALLSDYSYARFTGRYIAYRPLGSTPHQTLHLIADGGWYADGPRSRNAFGLGGASRLRGYESDWLEGQRYWHVAAEYLRPLGRNWLRLLAVAEAGGTDDAVLGRREGGPYASVGLGVRIRLTWFVDIEIEAGIAYPLRGGDGARFFARGN